MTPHPPLSWAPDADDPVQDLARLEEIADLDLFSPRAQARLDAFARRAAERFDLPVGLVSIVLDSAQVFAGRSGTTGWLAETDGTPVEWSFCATVVRDRAPYAVADATLEPRQADNPLVTQDGVRAYAGAPLTTRNGVVLGSCCVLGDTPRAFTADELAGLEELAAEVVAGLEADRLSDRLPEQRGGA